MVEEFRNLPPENQAEDSTITPQIPISHLEFIRACVKAHRDDPENFGLEALFLNILMGPDPLDEEIDLTAGHVAYRLSDFVDPEERKIIAVQPAAPEIGYPGTIVREGIQWHSLEEWRSFWKRVHPDIPEFVKKLPSGLDLNNPK